MKILIYISILFLLLSCKESLTPNMLIDQVIDIIEDNSIFKDSLDLNKIRQEALEKIVDSNVIDDTYPIIQDILSQLGDNHSHIYKPDQSDRWKGRGDKKEDFQYKTTIINDNIGYIFIPYFISGNSRVNQKYAQNLQDKIETLDQKNSLEGWIIDLRLNFGGNCWPMLTGLGPLIGDSTIGYFIDSDEEKQSIIYKDGLSYINDEVQLKIKNPICLQDREKPIAILISERTASSGELIAILFAGRTQTRFFGNKTKGLTTGNESFELLDGSILFLTTSNFMDKNQNLYLDGVIPDIRYYYQNINYNTPENDPMVLDAIQWIKDKKNNTQQL